MVFVQTPPIARCDRSYPADLLSNPLAYPNAVLFGTVFDRSLRTQRAREQAVELAATQANDVGGVVGRPVTVIFCTEEEDPARDALTRSQAAVAIASHLSSALEVDAIIGPSSSGSAILAFQETSETSDRALARGEQKLGFETKNIFLTDGAANVDVLRGAQDASTLFPRVRGSRPASPEGFVYDLFVAPFDLLFEEDVSQRRLPRMPTTQPGLPSLASLGRR